MVHHALAANDLALALRASIAAGTAAARPAHSSTHRGSSNAPSSCTTQSRRRGLIEGGRSRLLVLAAQAASLSGDPERGLRLWREALNALGEEVSTEERAEILLGLAIDANDTFENDAALEATRAANELLAVIAAVEPAGSCAGRSGARPVGRQRNGGVGRSQPGRDRDGIGRRRPQDRSPCSQPRRPRPHPSRARRRGHCGDRGSARDRPSNARPIQRRLGVHERGWLYGEVGQQSRAGDLLIGEAVPLARDLGLPTAAIDGVGDGLPWLAGRWSEGRKALDDWAREGGCLQRPRPRSEDRPGPVRRDDPAVALAPMASNPSTSTTRFNGSSRQRMRSCAPSPSERLASQPGASTPDSSRPIRGTARGGAGSFD